MEFLKNPKVQLTLSILAGAGGVVAILVYLDNRKNKKLSDRILYLDKEIKELDLSFKKNRNKDAGISVT